MQNMESWKKGGALSFTANGCDSMHIGETDYPAQYYSIQGQRLKYSLSLDYDTHNSFLKPTSLK